MKIKLLFLFVFQLLNYSAQTDSLEFAKAELEFEKGNFSAALKSIEKVVDKKNNVFYYTLKSEILFELKKYQESFDILVLGLDKNPESFILHNYMGIFLSKLDDNDQAIMSFTTALEYVETEEDEMLVLVNRATSYSAIRKFEESYNDLIKAYVFDTTNVAAIINLGAICDEIGKTEEAIMYLERALLLDLTEFEYIGIYANLGFQHQNLGKYEKAIEYYNKVIELDPKEALGYSNRSYNKMMLRDLKGAMQDIDMSIKLYPENSYAYMVKGKIYIEQGKKKQACEQFQMALDRNYTQRYGEDVENLKKENCN